jgi:predicted phosphate transport protein (TIGR00153 family)
MWCDGMVFPVETEERVKRKALDVSRDHLREIIDVARKISQLMASFVSGDKDSVKQLYQDIKTHQNNVDVAQRNVARELAEIGAILVSREDFLRFTNLTGNIAGYCEGVAFRLLQIMDKGWKVPNQIKDDLSKLSDAVFDTIFKLRETAMTLNYGTNKAMEKAREVDTAERIVDDLYRQLEITLIDSKMDFPLMLLLWTVVQNLEEAADKAKAASDAASILALTI